MGNGKLRELGPINVRLEFFVVPVGDQVEQWILFLRRVRGLQAIGYGRSQRAAGQGQRMVDTAIGFKGLLNNGGDQFEGALLVGKFSARRVSQFIPQLACLGVDAVLPVYSHGRA